jgi:hypothetical protein
MYIASAYPNSALSALTMMVIGLVMAGALAAWLGLVFLADRQPRKARGDAAPAAPDDAAEDEQRHTQGSRAA